MANKTATAKKAAKKWSISPDGKAAISKAQKKRWRAYRKAKRQEQQG